MMISCFSILRSYVNDDESSGMVWISTSYIIYNSIVCVIGSAGS